MKSNKSTFTASGESALSDGREARQGRWLPSGTASSAERIIRVVYRSTPLFDAPSDAAIVEASTRNNSPLGVSGVLFRHKGTYYQVLEGPPSKVKPLLDVIHADPRHRDVQILSQIETSSRLFTQWTMGYVAEDSPGLDHAVELMGSALSIKVEIGIGYIQRIMLESVQPLSEVTLDSIEHPRAVTALLHNTIEEVEKGQRSGLHEFSILVSLAIIADLFLFSYLFDEDNAIKLRMFQVYGYALTGVFLSGALHWAGKYEISRLTLYFTGISTIAAHCLWIGYGLSAPTLPFVAVIVMIESFGLRGMNRIKWLTACALGVAALTAVADLAGWVGDVAAPKHHRLLSMVLLPIAAYLLGRRALLAQAGTFELGRDIVVQQMTMIERLRKALSARNQFFAAISHEVRTPMNGMHTAMTLLAHPKTKEESKARYIHTMHRCLDDLTTLMDDVLDISRLESGGFRLSEHPLGMQTLCEEIVEFFQPVAQANGNCLQLAYKVQGKDRVMSDAVRLRQMMSNYLNNAMKFTRNGAITVTVECAPETNGKSLWTISVADTGCGIEAACLPRLFKPFVQANNQHQTSATGAGLGLTIVAALAKQMGGTVGVESEPCRGSRFWFTVLLPAAAQT